MVHQLDIDNFQNLSSEIFTCIDYIVCHQCHRYLYNPVTLPCGHSICSSCLPSSSEERGYKYAGELGRHIYYCPFPKCSGQSSYVSDLRVDVTLAKIVQACVVSLSQPHPHEQYDEEVSSNHPIPTTSHFTKTLQPEFECQICYLILYNPITTTCGHTFCQECLLRTVDHSPNCPTCRGVISFPQIRDRSKNYIIQHLTEILFSEMVSKRQLQLQEKVDFTDAVPILVGGLVFPHMSYSLHIFEPSYRLLIRRCLETDNQQFGIVSRSKTGSKLLEYGTLVQIKSAQALNDGRFLVQIKGMHRFKVVDYSNTEGYHTAKVEYMEDCVPSTEKGAEDASVEEMMQVVNDFINMLEKSYPQLLNRLRLLYGPTPQALIPFSYWASCVIPIEDHEKYKLLCVDDTKLRLSMVSNWIETVRRQWGFVCPGCSIM